MTFQVPNRQIIPRHPVIIGDSMLERGSGSVQQHIYPANGAVDVRTHSGFGRRMWTAPCRQRAPRFRRGAHCRATSVAT